jgi:hypothetical protein
MNCCQCKYWDKIVSEKGDPMGWCLCLSSPSYRRMTGENHGCNEGMGSIHKLTKIQERLVVAEHTPCPRCQEGIEAAKKEGKVGYIMCESCIVNKALIESLNEQNDKLQRAWGDLVPIADAAIRLYQACETYQTLKRAGSER